MEPNQATYNNQFIPQQEQPFNWRKYIFLFMSNWYWFLITIFIALSFAYIKNRYTLPTYSVSATLLIEEEEEGASDLLNEIRSVRRRRRNIDLSNEIAKLNAFSLHRRTVDSLAWDIFWTGHGRIARRRPIYHNPPYVIHVDSNSSTWYYNQLFMVEQKNGDRVVLSNQNALDTIILLNEWNDINGWKFMISQTSIPRGYSYYSFILYDKNTLAKIYRNKLDFVASEETGTVISINSQGPILEREIDYINSFCQNYINTGLERKRLIAENSINFIDSQIAIIQDSLRNTEKSLLAFRVNQTVVDLTREGQLVYNKLQKFYDQKTQLQLKKNYYEYLTEYITSKQDPQAIIAPTLVDANDQLLIEQVQNLQKLYESREQLSFSAETENPSLIQINIRIHSARDKILEILNGLIMNNQLAWQQIDIEEQQIEEQLLQLPVSEQELINIQRKYEIDSEFYTFLMQKRTEAGIQRASTISNIRILDRASRFTMQEMGTKKSMIYLIAFILGLFIPASIIFLQDYLDTRVKDKKDIEDNTNIPILGVITHNLLDSFIPVQSRPNSAFAEAFRHIRTNLQYVLTEPDQKQIMVTSTLSGEGKTFVAVNLAAILAMNYKKVLLMGLDLRRPSIHRIFNKNRETGISNYLAKKCELNDIISPSNIENLDLMIAGPTPPNPAELISSNRMKELFDEASKRYDYIVVDTPPVALVTDAILISKHTAVNIFVIRQNYSHKEVINLINKYHEENQIKRINLLVNDIRYSRVFGYSYYYGYGYEYGYGYRYGYGYKYNSDYYTEQDE